MIVQVGTAVKLTPGRTSAPGWTSTRSPTRLWGRWGQRWLHWKSLFP